jgi:hypothetical protein
MSGGALGDLKASADSSFRAASEIAVVLMQRARMRDYGRVEGVGRLWSEDFLELLRGELTCELGVRLTEMTEEEVGAP